MMKERAETVSLIEKLGFYLVAAVLVVVPLIMRAHIYDPKLGGYPWFADTNFEVDIFLYHKAVMLVSVSAVMLVLLLFFLYRNRRELKTEYWLYPLFSYAFFATLSTLLSPFKEFGLHGIYEQQESLWVLLAYSILTLFSYFVIRTEEGVSFLIKVLLALGIITSLLGLSQLIGKDFFETDFAKALIIPQTMEEEFGFRENLHFKFSGSGNHQVYLTFYNPNYVGVFSALIFPIFTALSFGGRKRGEKILWGSLAIINFILAMGAGSKTFLGSFLVSGLLALILYRKEIKNGLSIIASFTLALALLTIGYFYYIKINPIDYVKNALNTSMNQNRIEDLTFSKEEAFLTYRGETLSLSFEEEKNKTPEPIIKDSQGRVQKLQKSGVNDFSIPLEAYKEVVFGIYQFEKGGENQYLLLVTLPEGQLRIGKSKEGYVFMTSVLKEDKIVKAPSSVLVNHDAFASGRGYIWSRTFSLLRENLILGTGADSFLLAFPQNDYIGKMNGGFGSMIISKPHNLFLQIGVQTGVLSLLSYLLLALIFVIKGLLYYGRTEFDSREKVFGASLLLGITGYLVSGMFNDSVLAVAPLYWVLLGAGYGVLYLLRKKEGEAVKGLAEKG